MNCSTRRGIKELGPAFWFVPSMNLVTEWNRILFSDATTQRSSLEMLDLLVVIWSFHS